MKPTLTRRSMVNWRSPRPLSSTSPMYTSPEVRRSRPATQWSSVDLPDPDGPMMAVNWPLAKPTVTPSRARTLASPRVAETPPASRSRVRRSRLRDRSGHHPCTISNDRCRPAPRYGAGNAARSTPPHRGGHRAVVIILRWYPQPRRDGPGRLPLSGAPSHTHLPAPAPNPQHHAHETAPPHRGDPPRRRRSDNRGRLGWSCERPRRLVTGVGAPRAGSGPRLVGGDKPEDGRAGAGGDRCRRVRQRQLRSHLDGLDAESRTRVDRRVRLPRSHEAFRRHRWQGCLPQHG